MPSGGSVSFVFGFLFCTVCSLCLAASLGELASRWPTAGGQYHYAYALASEKWRKSMVSHCTCCFRLPISITETPRVQSFLVGWINIAGWLTLNTTAAYFGGNECCRSSRLYQAEANMSSSFPGRRSCCWLSLYLRNHEMGYLSDVCRGINYRCSSQPLRISDPKPVERGCL